MTLINDFFQLFFPKLCVTCSSSLLQSEEIICTHCRHDLPIITYQDFRTNKIANSFAGRIPIEMASSFLFYRRTGKTKELIHSLKYKGNQKVGEFFGNWFGFELKNSNYFNEINAIIPVPLHPKKLKSRGYNQLTTFGIALATQLSTKYTPGVLVRTSVAATQTFKQRFERFNDGESKFNLTNTETFQRQHVLLIDDVITTGATLEACCKELLKTPNIKISIVTIAYTE